MALSDFLGWCDKLGIANPGDRKPTLIASIKALSHESVLFFLCGRDYVHKPTDLKLQGIQQLFIGQGTTYEINISASALAQVRASLAGVRPNGAANYNLGTKALSEATGGFGAAFLGGMISGVKAVKAGGNAMVTPAAASRTEQDMRNNLRRFWMGDLSQIGL